MCGASGGKRSRVWICKGAEDGSQCRTGVREQETCNSTLEDCQEGTFRSGLDDPVGWTSWADMTKCSESRCGQEGTKQQSKCQKTSVPELDNATTNSTTDATSIANETTIAPSYVQCQNETVRNTTCSGRCKPGKFILTKHSRTKHM